MAKNNHGKEYIRQASTSPLDHRFLRKRKWLTKGFCLLSLKYDTKSVIAENDLFKTSHNTKGESLKTRSLEEKK